MSQTNRCKVHRYRRITRPTGRDIWKCMDCPHYLYDKAQIIGRLARCYNEVCDNTLKISFNDLQKAKVTCGNCIEVLPVEGIGDILGMLPSNGKDNSKEEESSSLEDIVRNAIRSGSEQD